MAIGETPASLTHLGPDGAARMVDVSPKAITQRTATAKGSIRMSGEAADLIRSGNAKKGDVLQIARIAAIQAAKQTSNLIPLCHLLPLEKVEVEFLWIEPTTLQCSAQVTVTAKTGVEMEALTAVTVGLLTVYDMLKAVDRSMQIETIALWQKAGGTSGAYQRDEK